MIKPFIKKPFVTETEEKEYYENAKEKGLNKNLVDYVWKVLIATQRGYGLSQLKY